MKILFTTASVFGACFHFISAETIIGYDGKEIEYGSHRDGLHDRALHEHRELRSRKHDLRHAKLHHVDASYLPHMLNQAHLGPTIKHRTNHTSHSLHVKPLGASPAADTLRKELRESASALSRTDRDKFDSIADEKEDLSERIAARLGRVAHSHVRGSRYQHRANVAEVGAADKFAQEFVKAPEGVSPPLAPSPGLMNAPASGPAPMPMAGGGWGTMDEDMGAPEQGFKGKIVEHDNMITMTKDWRGEYGPEAKGLNSYVKICALYPDNAWCRDRGYHRTTPPPKSSAPSLRAISLTTAFAFLCLSFA